MAEPVAYRLWVQDFRRHRFGEKKPPVTHVDFATMEEAMAAKALKRSDPECLVTVTPVYPAPVKEKRKGRQKSEAAQA